MKQERPRERLFLLALRTLFFFFFPLGTVPCPLICGALTNRVAAASWRSIYDGIAAPACTSPRRCHGGSPQDVLERLTTIAGARPPLPPDPLPGPPPRPPLPPDPLPGPPPRTPPRTPSPDPLPRPKRPSREKPKFTVGKIWFGPFWYTNFWVPDPPPLLSSHTSLGSPTPQIKQHLGALHPGGPASARPCRVTVQLQ